MAEVSADDVASNLLDLQTHLQQLDYELGDVLTRQIIQANADVFQRALSIQESFSRSVGQVRGRAMQLEANWPRALRRAKREELDARGHAREVASGNRKGQTIQAPGAAKQYNRDWVKVQRGGTFPTVDVEQLTKRTPEWWADVKAPIYHMEANYENLIVPQAQTVG